MVPTHRSLLPALDALSRQIAIVDARGAIRTHNAAFREYARANGAPLGQGPAGVDYLDTWLAASGAREHSGKVQAGLQAVQSGVQSSFLFEYTVQLAGVTRSFALSVTGFADGAEPASVERLLVIEHEDVTLRKQLERQFHYAQKMDALGQLASGVAHDFNNLLTVIRSYGDLLAQEFVPDGQQRADMDQILKASDAASALTKQLLTFGRQQLVKREVLDLSAIIAELDTMLRRLLGEDIEYVTLRAPRVPRIEGDAGQIQQILMNLVMNARDAMPRGGKLTIQIKDVVLDEAQASRHGGIQPGRYALIELTDTGTGMSLEVQARIFEPFFTTKEVGKGTGLGLSTVYGIVQQCSGHIAVSSELERGTSFEIYLPCLDQSSAGAHLPSTLPAPVVEETILVVEDNIAVRSVLCRVLKDAGYVVLAARDAAEASAICNSHQSTIQLLMSDVVMPGVSGPELAVELLRRRPDMKVLFMSGYSGTAITRHGVLREGLAFLPKPFSPASVRRAVRAVLAS